jgi:PAS domain-containing protein
LGEMLSFMPVGVFVVDANKDVVYANPTAERLFEKEFVYSKGYRCGDFISCKNRLKDPFGCGYSSDCPSCPLLNSIRSVLGNNKP